MYTIQIRAACQAAIASRAGSYSFDLGTSGGNGLVVRPPSPAEPAPTVLIWVHQGEMGWLSGRHRQQSRLLQLIWVHRGEMGCQADSKKINDLSIGTTRLKQIRIYLTDKSKKQQSDLSKSAISALFRGFLFNIRRAYKQLLTKALLAKHRNRD